MINPDRIWNDPSLSAMEKVVLAVLCHKQSDGSAKLTNAQIARYASISIRTVQTTMSKLKERRIIAVSRPSKAETLATTFAPGPMA